MGIKLGIKIVFALAVFYLPFHIIAQVPQGVNYQGVLRNKTGQPIKNQTVGVQVSVYDSIVNRKNNYIERHSVQTNEFGLYNLVIGKGNVVLGVFDSIPWGVNNQFLEVKIDPLGGQNYSIIGSQAMYSVPYAFYAGSTKSTDIAQTISFKNDSLVLSQNGGAVFLKPYMDNTDTQKLVKLGKQIQISNGNSIKLNSIS